MILDGKTIVIVGAEGLLGRAFVQGALDEGANVTAADSRLPGDAPPAPPRLLRVACDVTDAASIERVFAETRARFGGIDGAVNTAYPRNRQYGRKFLDVSYADFCENVGLNLGGALLLTQASVRHALETKRPFSLVNLSSIYGSMAPRFGVYDGTAMTMPVEYAAIKAGLDHLTRYACAYAKGSLFRCNCVSPGGILAGQPQSFLDRYNSHCRSKGMLDPGDIVGAVMYLLSDKSVYVVGQNIVVDDGFSL